MRETRLPFERFAALSSDVCAHAFVHRVPGIDVSVDKAQALDRLDGVHAQVRASLGLDDLPFLTAEQVHGNRIAVADHSFDKNFCFGECDGLITNQANVCLGIYVADCCAVYLVDPVRRCLGLVHSGKKGTELGIVPRAIAAMNEHFGTVARDLIVQLSPCIRPPHYEVDFAAKIVAASRKSGVHQVNDSGLCPACDLVRYYSYRAEKGKTGRMLALLALNDRSTR